ncbi:uncharacterized protein FRV6_14298 [Fusarium oxysporum]|uniref:Uncharacterized protein n=1 Tax=Fusarium oxysporum TaxID=5507 RepID=A0A2H3TZH8_FUSOX|nr:uncharacterized protein FRV6_14298 [Fusarium oxysporum]
MALLASAAPIISNSALTAPVQADLTLDRRAILAPDSSRDTISGNALERRANRRMTVPNSVGSAVQNIGVIVVKAIIDTAGQLLFEITNNSPYPYKVSLREVDTGLDAANLNVAGRHTMEYNPLGGIKAGDIISINTQNQG